VFGIPILLDGSEKLVRSGKTFRGRCPNCGQEAKMHEAVKRTNVSLWFAVSLWDSDEPVVQCGECLVVLSIKRDDAAAAKPLPSATRPPPASFPPKKPVIDEREIDRELAAMKRRLGK
jgi:hypothetical protein